MASLSDLTAGGGSSQPDAAATLLGKFHSRYGHYEYVPSTPLAPGKYVVKSSYAQRGGLEVHANTGVQKYSRGDNAITFDLTQSTTRLNMTHSSWEYDVEQQRRDFNLTLLPAVRSTEGGTANPYWNSYANNRMMATDPTGKIVIQVNGIYGQVNRSIDGGKTWQTIGTTNDLVQNTYTYYEAWTVEYNNGRFIISSGITETWNPIVSYDGFTWTQLPNMPQYNAHPLNNAVRAATTNTAGTTTVWIRQTTDSSRNMVYTTDGNNFFYTQSNLSGNPLQIYHDGTQFIATDDGNRLVFSADGISWSAAITNAFSIRSMTKLGSFYYVITTAGVVYRSTVVNGTWTLLGTISTSAQTHHQLHTYGNVLVYFDPVNGKIRTSTDGVTWTDRLTNIVVDQYNTIAKGGDYLHVMGNQNFRTTDGVNYNSKIFLPVSNQYATAYGAGLYVNVGTSGQIYTSPDLNEHWTQRTSNTGATLTNVHYANGLFVAVGTSGVIVTSPDGISWAVRSSNVASNTIWGLEYANNLWVLCSEGGYINTSTDGINWTNRSSTTGNALRNVAYGNGIWMVVGDSATVLTSTDGFTWVNRQWVGPGSGNINTSQYVGQIQLFGVAYGAGKWVVGGASSYVLTSTDNGVTWVSVKRTNFYPENGAMPTNATIAYIRYVNSLFIAYTNNGTVFTSVNGLAWRVRASSVTGLTGKHFNYLNGAYVFTSTNSNRLGYTTDLDNWNWLLNTVAVGTIYGTAYNPNNGRWTITASGGIFDTQDFRTWTNYQPNYINNRILQEIVYANNIYVSRSNQSGQMYWSEDGRAWFPATATNWSDTYSNNIIYEDGSFWKVWNGKIQRSLDGKVWTDFFYFNWNEYQPRFIKKVDGYYVVFGDNRYATYQTYWINKNMLTEPKQWTQQYLNTTISSGYIIDIDGIDGVYVFCFAGQNTAVNSTLWAQRSGNNNGYGYFLYNTEGVVNQISGRKVWVIGKDIFVSDGTIYKVVKNMPSSTNTSPTSNIARASLTGISQNSTYYPTKWGGHVYTATSNQVYDFDANVETTFSLYNSTLVNVN